MNKIIVILERSADGLWASVPGLPGCFSFGKTETEAITNTREAISLHIEGLKDLGTSYPEQFDTDYSIGVTYQAK